MILSYIIPFIWYCACFSVFLLVTSAWRLAEWWWITISVWNKSKHSRDPQKCATFGANVSYKVHVSQMLWCVCQQVLLLKNSQLIVAGQIVRVRKKHIPRMNTGILGMGRWDAPGDNGAANCCNPPKWWIPQLQIGKENIRSWALPSPSQ